MFRGAYDTPTSKCPYCGTHCDADWVDVGIGMQQCGPYHCEHCGASEIGAFDKERQLSEQEKKVGWYGPASEPGSSANVIGGKIVSHRVMDAEYREQFAGNPDYLIPGAVEEWRAEIRRKA